ncbi:MAG: precorrin-2 C(20)-methyltransferase, partial [Clostridiales bacterium]|nr:precorrin-2 C(20)-methyltransferase [Clostridiales bacterium]
AKLYGIGVGPGDPELLTLKARKAIQQCAVIAGQKNAFAIIAPYLEGKNLLECAFAMVDDMTKRREARLIAAGQILAFLEAGQDVGFVTLGDPTTYSTYMYVHELIKDKGFDVEIIPGVTSYAAAAAALGLALCEDNEVLTIIPAKHNINMDTLLDAPGNKVFMKSGENLTHVLEKVKARGQDAMIACRVGMAGQTLYRSIDEYNQTPETGYFTVAIVRES